MQKEMIKHQGSSQQIIDDYHIQFLLMKDQDQATRPNSQCSICMQRSSKCSLSGCSHLFCYQCIKKWSKRHNTCPLCRSTFRHFSHRGKIIRTPSPPAPVRTYRRPIIQNAERRIAFFPIMVFSQSVVFPRFEGGMLYQNGQMVDYSAINFAMNSYPLFVPYTF